MLANTVVLGAVVLVLGCRGDEPAREPRSVTAPIVTADAAIARINPMPPCTGCEPSRIATLPTNRGTGLALAGTVAYVSTFFDDAIYRGALDGSAAPVVLYHSPGANLGDVEVHGDELRWSSNATGRIYSAPVSGVGPVTVLADALPGIWGFASDDAWIYWADFGGSSPGAIWRRPLRGGPSVRIADDPRSTVADHALIDGDQIMYTDQSARLMRVPVTGGTPEAWIEVGGDEAFSGISADATHYYASTLSGNHVLRIDRTTRSVEIVATDPAAPSRVAVDASHVYWVDYTPVEVWSRTK